MMTLTSGTSQITADGRQSPPPPDRAHHRPRVDLDAAVAQIRAAALCDAPVGRVGIEIEGHVHHRDDPQRPLSFEILDDLATSLTPLPYGGRVTLEPGGQVEVSSDCHPDAAAAIAATRAEVDLVGSRLAELGLRWTFRGADPWRSPRRVHPGGRYQGMEEWFAAGPDGGHAGRTMMCATAALQVNLEAGHPDQWADRVRRAGALAPILIALSGSSRWLAGADTGFHSMRQRNWADIDPRLGGPLEDTDDPAQAWVERVLAAPLLHLAEPAGLRAAEPRRSLQEWLADAGDWPEPTADDIARHLTTQFPPVRLRGFLELRCIDALPEPWWPALVAAVVTWMDDPAAHAPVDEALSRVRGRTGTAAELGLADRRLRAAAVDCLEVAVDLSPTERSTLADLCDLARGGRSPGDLLPTPDTRGTP